MEKRKLPKISDQDLNAEIWREIQNAPGFYVSNMGRVKHKNHIMQGYYKKRKKRQKKANGDLVRFAKVQGKEVKISKLVWNAFVGEYDGSTHGVVHKLAQNDDRLINLQLLSIKELGSKYGGSTKRARGIYMVNKETKTILDFYKSTRDAEEKTGCSRQFISDQCNNVYRKNFLGVEFIWADEDKGYQWYYEERENGR